MGDKNVAYSPAKINDEPSNKVSVKREGSRATIVKNNDGTTTVIRKSSSTDVRQAVSKRISSSSHSNILDVLGVQTNVEPAPDHMKPLDDVKKDPGFVEHLWDFEAISRNYDTHIDVKDAAASRGLKESTAASYLADPENHHRNVLTPPPKIPLWLLFLIQFTNPLMVLLMIVAICCFALFGAAPTSYPNLYIAVLLTICVFITCYETFSQEAKSDELMEKFRAMVPAQAAVIRDGEQNPVDASDIFPGDIIKIKSGDKIPADCRVIFAQSMKVDQSMITGESDPIDISVDAKSPNAVEAKNIIFNGSLCVEGTCLAVAIRTGDDTFIGKMVGMTGDTGKSASTLQADIIYFVRVLTIFALFQAMWVFIIGCAVLKIDATSVFTNGFIVIMIGNIPQGLPSTITACLFIVADRMGKKNVFVKKLDIIETLGSCNVICTDKTGTLTMNEMTVENLWVFNDKKQNKQAVAASTSGGLTLQFQELIKVATLNSRVVIENDPIKGLVPTGDATELGLFRFFTKMMPKGVDIQDFRNQLNPKVHEIPFNSKNKWQMSIHNLQEGHQIMFVKGAPDVLLSKCSHYLDANGNAHVKDAEFERVYNTQYEAFGGNGERVLGFARQLMDRTLAQEEALNKDYKELLKERLVGAKDNAIRDLVFVGLVTLQDPPREEVPQAVRDCHTAGVKVVMVTGDHPLTAEAIARQIGLITKKTRSMVAKERGVPVESVRKDDPDVGAVVVRGVEISGSTLENIEPMTEDDWKILVATPEIVFARTSPENKLTIVKEFTKAGNVTAMTGDGVNDSPALKQAAIGVAMGKNGSDVAKEAGDIILLDDNFASIVVGIKEGRLLFANLKKSVGYSLAHLVPEVIPVLLWAFIGCPQPMGSLLALCVDLLTELLPASSFAYEKAEGTIMQVPPRDLKREKLTSFQLMFYAYGQSGMILTGGCYFVYFRAFARYGVTAYDLFHNYNKYFPTPDGSTFHTSDGRTYSPREQMYIMTVIWGAWYLMIVVGQAIHVNFARTTTISIFKHGFFWNTTTNIGIVVAIWLGCFVTYMPGVEGVVQAGFPYSADIFYASLMVFWCFLTWTEGRKWVTRNYPDSLFNKIFGW